MNWFDATGFASFAKNALTTAQKTIDKALEIKEDIPSEAALEIDFFETYGLSTTNPKPKPTSPSKPERTEPPTEQKASQSSNYWTDTWGSFFETKAPVPEVQVSPGSSEAGSSSPKKAPKNSDAVSSQPQRASLFPTGGDIKKQSPGTAAPAGNKEQSADAEVRHSQPEGESEKPTTSPDPSEFSGTPGAEVISDSSVSQSSESAESPAAMRSVIGASDDDREDTSVLCEASSGTLKESVPEVSPPAVSEGSQRECFSEKDEISDSHSAEPSAVVKSAYDVVKTEEHAQTFSESAEMLSDDSGMDPDEPARENSSMHSPEPYNNFADSFVNLETGDENSRNDASDSEKDTSSCESKVVHHYGDSFHILSTSVLESRCAWADVQNDDHTDDTNQDSSPEDHHSATCDSGSTTSKEDDMEVRECDVKSVSSGGSQEISRSFVKCSIEEVDDGCHRGQSPFSTTTSERSDVMKLESEQNTSGDENETTTSSDIEVLSAPNCDNGERNSSPLKHMWMPRTLRIRRSESPSSDCSKDSSMPIVRESEELGSKMVSEPHNYEAEKHLACFTEKKLKSIDLDRLFQQQEELQTLLDAREKKVIELSKENLRLREVEEALQNQLQEIRRNQANDSHNLSNMTKELTCRLSQLEGEVQRATAERDSLKKQLEEAQVELCQRISRAEMDEAIKEKDQQIKELLQEGEKLSKKELQHTTIIKKLRVKEDEMEHTIKSLKDKLDENSKEVERLRRSMGAKDEQEKKHIDAIRQLTNLIRKHEKELVSLKNSLEDSVAKEEGLKNSLDSTMKELTELRAECAAKDKEIKDLTLSVELAATEKLREGLDQANKEAYREKEALILQIEDLRNSMKFSEEQANQRENALKDDISRLQLRLQEAEARNEELTKSISSATRPLVRQIENLQSSYNSQIASWEKIEKNLSDQLSDSQSQLAVSTEREKLATEKYFELSSKYNKLEIQNSELRKEKSQLTLELQVQKTKIADFEENMERDNLAVNSLRQSFATEVKQLKEERERLSSELQNSLELLKEERQTVRALQEELKNKDAKLQGAENNSPCPSPSASVMSSVESVNNWGQDDPQERRLSTPVSSHRISVYDSLRIGCTTSILESLQSQLKQREGEIAQLQCEITKLEREREAVSQELVDVTSQNESLQENVSKLQSIEKLYKDVNQRYNTLLQMYGEKVEECEELKLDLADVKTAYKVQIEELLSAKTIN